MTNYFADLTLSDTLAPIRSKSLELYNVSGIRLNSLKEIDSHLSQAELDFSRYYQQFTGQTSEPRSLWRTPNQFPTPHQSLLTTIWTHPATKIGVVGVGCLAGLHFAGPSHPKRQVTPAKAKPTSIKPQVSAKPKPVSIKPQMSAPPRPIAEFSSSRSAFVSRSTSLRKVAKLQPPIAPPQSEPI